MTYIDVSPDPAAAAARATARTAPTWEAWARQTHGVLKSAATSSNDTVVTAAFETYVGDINPRIQSLALLAEQQGVDLGGAVQAAIDGDHAADAELRPAEQAVSSQTPQVKRGVNLP